MSGLRSSNSVINTVVDTLRFRGVTEPGLLITSSSGAVSVGTAPTLSNLTVTGASILGSAVVMGPLTANSVNALVSLDASYATITNLDASNATIDTLTSSLIEAETVNVSNATITNTFGSFLDVSNAIIDILDVSAASIRSLDVSNATITNLSFSSASVSSLDISNAIIDILTARNGSITNLDVSNATIANLDISSASVSSLDASAAVIINLDASSAWISMLDASNAIVDTLIATNCSISSLDASNGVITYLDVSAASISSLDVSNGVITYLDVSAATFNRLDASSVSVPGGVIIADRARIGQDISENFVFITAFSSDTIGRIRGSNRSNGTLQLGANINNDNNIVLNADGSSSIETALIGENTNLSDPSANFVFIQGVSGETVGRICGSNHSNGTLRLGANADSSSNIILDNSGTTIPSLVINNPIHATYTSPYITTFSWTFPYGDNQYAIDLVTPVSPAGLWYCGVKAVTNQDPPNIGVVYGYISTTYITDGTYITYGGAVASTSGSATVHGTHIMHPGNYQTAQPDWINLVYASPELIPGNYEAKFILLMTF